MTESTTAITQALFREVLGHYPTGVTIVTGTAADGEHLAMIVGTFTSVSLDPPLVAFLPMRTSKTFARLAECESLCINVLTGDQEDLGRTIASRWENKLDGVDWFPSPSGDPILADSLAWLDVRLESTIEAGDHSIALCRIVDMAVHNPVAPLIFFQGGYGSFVIPPLVARIDDGIIAAVTEAVSARDEIDQLATEIGCEVGLITAVNRDELATVASAVGPGKRTADGLGERLPMIPPIGDTYIATAGSEHRDYWLAKAKSATDEQRKNFEARLDYCREHGYLVSFLPEEGEGAYANMSEAAHQYAAGKLTPAQEREIRDRISRTAVDYAPRELKADETYDVGSIVIPLTDRNGESTLTLRLGQLPRRASGAEVKRWVDRGLAAARAIEAQLATVTD
ncbi:flavin reductase family protein [Granulicoccus sp. GXG6511]|uniref:flavin reductase family protein n=1 Tax=Granulicoccus sp. GXG6511 TaxID=3381351 RepID=UPI003D7D570D